MLNPDEIAQVVRIERSFVDEMVAHAQDDLPNECCGILAGPGPSTTSSGHTERGEGSATVAKSYRMTNVEASPYRFSMDPGELVRVDSEAGDNGWELLAIYHSHTGSPAYPSDTDVRIAGGTAGLWPDTRYVLVSLMDPDHPDVRIFQISGGVVTEETLEVY